jgi:deoxyribodipyrimidine photo-lyase
MNYRTRELKKAPFKEGPVVYWMSRDQRIHDNWALITAQNYAAENKVPLVIVFSLSDNFLNAEKRMYNFMLNGLKEIHTASLEYNIPFFILKGDPSVTIPDFIKTISASALFADFDPLKIKLNWLKEVTDKIDIPVYQTDAHNVVPAFIVSDKEEYSAVHFRRKLLSYLPEFTEEFPPLLKMEKTDLMNSGSDDIEELLNLYKGSEIKWIKPGQQAAYRALENFLESGLNNYDKRNDPNSNAISGLSPYLHYGQLSAQRILLNVQKMNIKSSGTDAFLDELIVRRELSDNHCFFNSDYDKFSGFPRWGQETLNKHRKDEREYVYSLDIFEKGETHDDLWNASQMEMIKLGKMHGYMRMYWCKKILEWTESPEQALRTAIYLNDKYELDGRDPNGYTGIAWSIGGLHDRPFAERPVFGRIRYMNYNGCKRKFNTEEYIRRQSDP